MVKTVFEFDYKRAPNFEIVKRVLSRLKHIDMQLFVAFVILLKECVWTIEVHTPKKEKKIKKEIEKFLVNKL